MSTQQLTRITMKVETTHVRSDGDQIDVRETRDFYVTEAAIPEQAIALVSEYHRAQTARRLLPNETATFYIPEFSTNAGSVWRRNPEPEFFAARSF